MNESLSASPDEHGCPRADHGDEQFTMNKSRLEMACQDAEAADPTNQHGDQTIDALLIERAAALGNAQCSSTHTVDIPLDAVVHGPCPRSDAEHATADGQHATVDGAIGLIAPCRQHQDGPHDEDRPSPIQPEAAAGDRVPGNADRRHQPADQQAGDHRYNLDSHAHDIRRDVRVEQPLERAVRERLPGLILACGTEVISALDLAEPGHQLVQLLLVPLQLGEGIVLRFPLPRQLGVEVATAPQTLTVLDIPRCIECRRERRFVAQLRIMEELGRPGHLLGEAALYPLTRAWWTVPPHRLGDRRHRPL